MLQKDIKVPSCVEYRRNRHNERRVIYEAEDQMVLHNQNAASILLPANIWKR